MYLIAGRPPEYVSPEPLGEGPPCPPLDPESLCASSHISRTTSAFALPGFGYTPGFSSTDNQPCSPRYVRLQADSKDQGCNDLGINCGVTRYDSLPPVSRKELLLEAVAPAESPAANGSTLIRALSVPHMPTPLTAAQLQSAQSATPQSQAWGLARSFSTPLSVDEKTARSALNDADTASPHAALDTVGMAAQSTDVITIARSSRSMPSELPQHADELSGTSADTAPLLGAFDPASFKLPPGLVWTQNDSFDEPGSVLQAETVQIGASNSDYNHTN